MECPVCGNNLEEQSVEEITVDVCKGGCGGIWFDRFELQKVDEPHECAGEKLLDAPVDTGVVINHDKKRKCPKCEDSIMMRHFFSVKQEVEVDECPKCAGMWLDCGELRKIRSQFGSEKERIEAADKYFSDIFGVELERMRAENKSKTDNAKRIASIFRFLCPSYYLPGKQKWGAF
ncbi:zf-TFIIB domain-containing protein [Thermodesulfobacteriota bacterium]